MACCIMAGALIGAFAALARSACRGFRPRPDALDWRLPREDAR